jgi:hypothetical protein
MITMKQYSDLLIKKWIINKSDVEWLYNTWIADSNI